MDERLRNVSGVLPKEPVGEASVGVVLGLAMVVPMFLCCVLPLLLAAGIGTVAGAVGTWLAGFGGVEIAAGAVVFGAAGYELVRRRTARGRRCGEPTAWKLPGVTKLDETVPSRATTRAAALESVNSGEQCRGVTPRRDAVDPAPHCPYCANPDSAGPA